MPSPALFKASVVLADSNPIGMEPESFVTKVDIVM